MRWGHAEAFTAARWMAERALPPLLWSGLGWTAKATLMRGQDRAERFTGPAQTSGTTAGQARINVRAAGLSSGVPGRQSPPPTDDAALSADSRGSRESVARLLDGIEAALADAANEAPEFCVQNHLVYLIVDVMDARERLAGIQA